MSAETDEQGTLRYVRCDSCGSANSAGAVTCAHCGAPLQANGSSPASQAVLQPMRVVCPKCRKVFPMGSKFCGFCGTPLPAAAQQVAPPQRAAARTPVPPISRPPAASRMATPALVRRTPPQTPLPAASCPAADETMVFSGLHTASIEAQIREKKPDGTLGDPRRVTGEVTIGRTGCDVVFPDDVTLAEHHASLSKREGKLLLRDLGSVNGTFLKQRQDGELVSGDIFLLGREILRFTSENVEDAEPAESTLAWAGSPMLQPLKAKLERIKLTGEVLEEFNLNKPETTLGRTKGDLIFKNDPYMSGTHARLVAREGRFVLQDLQSRNGIFRRVRDEVELTDGDEFFLGEHLFRAEIKQEN